LPGRQIQPHVRQSKVLRNAFAALIQEPMPTLSAYPEELPAHYPMLKNSA
jgi:hypothetical protein